jgi:hypothetical protein
MTASATDIHVATTGSDDNAGTEAAPLLTIHKAMEIVQPGDRILIHEGTYNITKRIKIPPLNTNPDMRCEMRAWPDDAVGKVIIDGTNMNPSTEIEFKQSRCIYVDHMANYWTFYGLVLQHAKDNGMKVEGSHNVIERCVFRFNNDTGLQIGMFKDWKIEETKSFPISGTPEFNPNYTYCRNNAVINCDAYENADLKSFSGSDDGGDADGFAVKLFPGPGTTFYGCRAWNNSDDNWDLYMTYHPVVIDHCWAYHAGYYTNAQGQEAEGVNGNGFKLGGGGSAGGAAFDQSTGAHVVTNCVSFKNLHKGFDQNNAYEGMYVINCTAWGNEFNYRFPTEFKYGPMTIRNSIGWGATAEKNGVAVGNHEFLSPDKPGYMDPDTKFCSWLEFDGCNPIKEGYKEGKTQIVTKDHSGEFLSLSVDDFKAPREADGSLPNNDFARLKPTSIFKDAGTMIWGFTPARKMTEAQCTAAGLEYITADDLYIPYCDAAPDLGAFEIYGVPADNPIPDKILVTCKTANSTQEVVRGKALADIVYECNDVATNAVVENLAEGLSYNYDATNHIITISGTPQTECTFKVTVSGNAEAGVKPYVTTGIITLVTPYKDLTNGWYKFQDAELPDALKSVVELVQGDNQEATTDGLHKKGDTYIDPEKEETSSGYSKGAVCLGQSNGGITLNLPQGALKVFMHAFFTGGRAFKITATIEGSSTPKTITTEKYKKGAYEFNLLDLLGLTTDAERSKVRTLTFQQDGANGGTRLYEMYITVPDDAPSAINTINSAATSKALQSTRKVIKNGKLIIEHGGKQYNALGQQQ